MAPSRSSETRRPASPRLFGAIGAVRREEWPFALLMFTFVFLVIASFWILKPLKKALFIERYDAAGLTFAGRHFAAAEVELSAKVLNMGIALAAVTLFTWLARRLRRERLSVVLMVFFVVGDLVLAQLLGAPGAPTVWGLYLFGDLFSTLMVAAFFAFLNDSVTPEAAKRLYGFVGLGAVLGGVVGSSVISAFVAALTPPEWLYVCAVVGVVVIVVSMGAGRFVQTDDATRGRSSGHAPTRSERSAALEGAALVLRSPYLLSIAAMVGLYEIVSTVMDFQFTSAVSHFLNGAAIGQHLSFVFAMTNVASLLVQLFVTSTVMQAWGVGTALMILPLTCAMGSFAFLAMPSLLAGSALNLADNAFNYSINQSAKEALYVPTSADEKYKAKAFIDMFVLRTAKAVAVGVSLAMGAWFHDIASARWLSMVSLGLIAVWVIAARYAGGQFPQQSR